MQCNHRIDGGAHERQRASGWTPNNAPPERIANLDETTAHWLKVVAKEDGSFILTNGRTGAAKVYRAR
jgi:hypothetical protein